MKHYPLKNISSDNIVVETLNPLHNTAGFNCGDGDLDEFLKKDALAGQNFLNNTTYLFLCNRKILGFATVCCDSIKLEKTEKKSHVGLESKEYLEFPAVKIARLAVAKDMEKCGLGSFILNWAVGFVLENIKIGCRFITVDAYPYKVAWYQNRGFVRNISSRYKSRQNVSMRFDLYIRH